jgi:hypothetical protein
MGLDLTPHNLSYSYNPWSKVLTIKPDGETVSFKDIGFIKFGNSLHEPNFCDPATFTYNVASVDGTTD